MPPRQSGDKTALKALKKDLKSGELKSLYIFHGEEAYLREHYLGQLKKAALPEGLEEFNLHTAREKDCSPAWLEQAVDCLPMMSGRTLVQVTDYDLFGGGEEQREELARVLSDLPDYCTVVFVYDVIPYKADGRSKLGKLLKEKQAVVEFGRQAQGDLTDWISRRFKAAGHTIDSEDARYLIFLCGDLMTNLANEIEKISACAAGQRITRRDIDAVAVPRVDAVVFRMTDALARKDFDKAAEGLAGLFQDRQPPIMLLSVMGKYFRQLYTARLCLEHGRGKEELMELWGMRSAYQADKLFTAARGFSLLWCRHAVRRCAQCDITMKSSYGQEEELLTGLLMELAAGRRGI